MHEIKLLSGNSVITALPHRGNVHTEQPDAFRDFSKDEFGASGKSHPTALLSFSCGTYIPTPLHNFSSFFNDTLEVIPS